MNKILIKVIIPSIEKAFDVFIPINKKVGKVAIQIVNTVYELTEGYYPNSSDPKMYDKQTGNLIDNKLLVKESGLKNESQVIIY